MHRHSHIRVCTYYIHIHTWYVSMRVCTCIHTCTNACIIEKYQRILHTGKKNNTIYIHTYTHLHLHAYMHRVIDTHVQQVASCTSTCRSRAHTILYTYKFIYTYTYIYTYTNTYCIHVGDNAIYIHPYIHTYKQAQVCMYVRTLTRKENNTIYIHTRQTHAHCHSLAHIQLYTKIRTHIKIIFTIRKHAII
jgi:hypothetical protein